jgi:hypothetical protein
MRPLTVVSPHQAGPLFEETFISLTSLPTVENALIVNQEPIPLTMAKCRLHVGPPLCSHETLRLILDRTQTDYLLLLPGIRQVSIGPETLEKMIEVAHTTGAGLVYSDFFDEKGGGKTLHPLNDYQPGSVRNDFDFGAMILLSMSAVRHTLKKWEVLPGIQFAGLYDLRLKVSIDHPVYHVRKPLYSVMEEIKPPGSQEMFAYVDPRNESVQKEMERVFTDYLKRVGAYLPCTRLRPFREAGPAAGSFPVEASVVIPVKNRRETISEAVKSALSQETDFPFNLIVVDNHSTDGTTAVLSTLAGRYSNLTHIVPERTDLGIGGCWNEALRAGACGRYVVQLDSDDLYSSRHTLQKMVDVLRREDFAMAIGSYTLVNSGLEEIPPGLIDHREWTEENGHNNALRINGLGAPRAFNTNIMRRIGFLNVSYGEDYAAALRISREYRIGRIYESLYLCRRWEGNTDAALSIEETNRNDAFKDKIRTDEILARQEMIKHKALE